MKPILYLLLFLSNLSLGQDGVYTQLSYLCKDGKERPFIVYTPKSLDKKVDNPLLIYLHGGISNPNLKKDPLAYIQKSKLIQLAEEGGFYLMFSYGQKGATWFDPIGTDMVLGEIETATNQFNIDNNKIFLSGFSDGASGVLYFSMTNPTPFAGFIAMNGSLKVAQKLGAFDLFPANTNEKPLYVINTKGDLLYPIHQIEPTIEYLKQFNKNIRFSSPVGNHEMSYLSTEKENILQFIETNSKLEQTVFSWETSSLKNNTINGISITKIDSPTTASKKWHQPYQLKVFNDKADFGLKYDYSFQGKGLKVNGFKDDACTSKKMGVKINDIILMMEQDSIKSPYTPYFYTARKKAGDSTALTVLRNGEQKQIVGTFNEGYYYQIFDETIPSAKIMGKIEDGKLVIHTSKVSEISIDMNVIQSFGIHEVNINNQVYNIELDGVQVIAIE